MELDGIETEIAEMLDDDFPTPVDEGSNESGGEPAPVEEEPEPTEEKVEEVVGDVVPEVPEVPTEPTVEGTPEGGEPVVEEVGEKEGVAEVVPEVPVEPLSEVDGLKAQVSTLMGLLNKAHSTPGVGEAIPPGDAVPSPADFGTFMEGVDFDKVMESKESFMEFFTKSMDIMRQQAETNVMAAVPNYVSGQVQRNATMRDVASEFYSTYPELTPVKGYVANVAAEVSAGNPTWDMNQVLVESARLTKETLGLASVATVPATAPAATKPVLSGGTRTAKAPPTKKSALQSELDDFLND